jgi:hypothetical protein
VEKQLYIRMKGRVLGPYDQEKLQMLARRGQLSRMHELSADATNWVRASSYPELFVGDDVPLDVASQQAASERRGAAKNDGQAPRAAGSRWWYRKDNSDVGPVDQATIQQMVAAGKLKPDDFVWTDGMPQWVSAQQVPGLLPNLAASQAQVGGGAPFMEPATGIGELPASLCRSALSSRPWVIFIAIVFFVYAGFVIVGGIFALIQGANHHLPPIVAWGLFALIFGLDYVTGGLLLLSYAGHVASLRFSPHPILLEKSYDALRTFWIFVSINLIIALAFVIFAAVWIIAIGGSIPWNVPGV